MDNFLVALSAALAVAAVLPYAFNTARGKTHPQLSSWTTWMLLNGINTVVAVIDGATRAAIFSGALTAGTVIVSVLGLWRGGIRRYRKFDAGCQLLGIAGIGLWLATDDPRTAVFVVLAVNIVTMLPTLHHAWVAPHAETWQTFGVNGVASVLTMVSLTEYTVVAVVPVVYVLVASVALVSIILGRRRTVSA